MIQIDKEAKRQKYKMEKNKASMEQKIPSKDPFHKNYHDLNTLSEFLGSSFYR
jgi:hypothetical protein